MKKKIVIVSLLLLAGTAVAVFAATRCKSEYRHYLGVGKYEWVKCEKNADHYSRYNAHVGTTSKGEFVQWHD